IENRTAMYQWFNRATSVGAPDVEEPKLTIEQDETLQCTPKGQVAGLKSRAIPDFTRVRAQELAKSHKPLEAEALAKAVTEVLRLPASGAQDRAEAPDYRILRSSSNRKYPPRFVGTYAVETEPGVHAL